MLKKFQTQVHNKAFLDAAKNGKDDAVKKYIASGVDIEAKDDAGRTALYLASSKSHTSTVKLLLELGAKPLDAKSQLDCNENTIDFLVKRYAGNSKLDDSPLNRLTSTESYTILYKSAVLAEQRTKVLEEIVTKQDTCIQELQKEVRALSTQILELTKQKTSTPKDDDSSLIKKNYSPNFEFQNPT